MPDFKYEKQVWKKGFRVVAGADEVGRGAFAGPVVAAAAVFLPNTKYLILNTVKVDDSKKLTSRQREKADKWIKRNCLAWGIGEASVSVINRLGLTKATNMAFRRAIMMLNNKCKMINSEGVDFLLVDAFYLPFIKGLRRKNQKAIIKGDQKSFSIAAASIIAKVYRDHLMEKLALKYPKYGWERNKGYGTPHHEQAILKYGITRLHRKKFISNVSSSIKAVTTKETSA